MKSTLILFATLLSILEPVTAAPPPSADVWTVYRESFENGLPIAWKELKFRGSTSYSVVKEGGTNNFLQARSVRAASAFGLEKAVPLSGGLMIRFRWRIDRIPSGASDDRSATFDHTARVFVAFKAFIGLPRTINYVWANQAPAGKPFEHPTSGRSKLIALESGNAKAGQWVEETRDIVADWRLLFGTTPPKEISAIGVMTDGDNTGQTVTGGYDDIELFRPKVPVISP